jgi:hypothetical protein
MKKAGTEARPYNWQHAFPKEGLFWNFHCQVESAGHAFNQESCYSTLLKFFKSGQIFFDRADDVAIHFQDQVSRAHTGITRRASWIHLDHHHSLIVPEAELPDQIRV